MYWTETTLELILPRYKTEGDLIRCNRRAYDAARRRFPHLLEKYYPIDRFEYLILDTSNKLRLTKSIKRPIDKTIVLAWRANLSEKELKKLSPDSGLLSLLFGPEIFTSSFDTGAGAFRAGIDFMSGNPFPENSPEFIRWDDGYEFAKNNS